MYKDYLNDVINYYQTNHYKADLPQRLLHPTSRGIKDECVARASNAIQKKDIKVLAAFFKSNEEESAIFKAINKCDIDRFKPLVNFLKGKTGTTDDLNIELLGWLIDFPDRPFNPKNYTQEVRVNEYGIKKEEVVVKNWMSLDNKENPPLGRVKEEEQVGDEKMRQIKRTQNLVVQRFFSLNKMQRTGIAFAAILFLGLLSFLVTRDYGIGVKSESGQQQCMIWTGDHYMAIPCGEKHGDTLVLALDLKKLKTFKKVMLTDTITMSSEGKLWYIKRNNKVEVFTEAGSHPIEPRWTLKPLSRYMIEKYFNHPEKKEPLTDISTK